MRARGLLAAALLASLAGRSASPGSSADQGMRRVAAASGLRGSTWRIGLDAAHRVTIASDRPYAIVDPATGSALWKESFRGETVVVADGGPEGEPPAVYRVQTGAFTSAEAAEAERSRLAAAFGEEAIVHYVPDRSSWRVRIGKATDRQGLSPLLARLREAGVRGLWIAEEPAAEPPGVRMRLVDADWASRAVEPRAIAVVPEGEATLTVQGKRYRGLLEVRLDRAGRLRPINWIGLEAYLRGVVPAELGPEVWPQLEALKAQAVAARTYAVANRGQFEDEGFDLCATPRCQVYGGVLAEHPLSDRAVAATAGEILTFSGKAISALYTATCGGHTEDAKEVFPEEEAPYLRGVPCLYEGAGGSTRRFSIRGRRPIGFERRRGEETERAAALLAGAGVLPDPPAEGFLESRPTGRSLRAATTALARLAGRPEPRGPVADPSTLARAAVALVRDLGWEERARLLLTDADAGAVLREARSGELSTTERLALAYLVVSGALEPGPELDPGAPVAIADLLPALVRIGESYDAFRLEEGNVVSASGALLRMIRGRGTVELTLAREPYLFSLAGGRPIATRSLELYPGDKVRFRTAPDGKVVLVELRPPIKGVADDRFAALYSWEVRKSRRELEESLNRRLSVGELEDLQVVRRGVSGRIAELRVVGSEGTSVVKGFDVRGVLDLRESLTVVEPVRDAHGALAAVVFAGKGWGHGVGLCQVGAYGMAMKGATYREILSHYYLGAVLETMSGDRP